MKNKKKLAPRTFGPGIALQLQEHNVRQQSGELLIQVEKYQITKLTKWS